MPNIQTLNENYDISDIWGEACSDAYTIISDILRTSLKLKKKKIVLEVSYYIRDLGQRDDPKTSGQERIIQNFEELTSEWFVNLFRQNRFFLVKSETRIADFERVRFNELGFHGFTLDIEVLNEAVETLSSYEEVYESVTPDSIKKVNQLFEDITREIFKVICKPKRIVIHLDKFNESDEMLRYLFEEILNYSPIAKKFSKVTELISELTNARKELFLKIS